MIRNIFGLRLMVLPLLFSACVSNHGTRGRIKDVSGERPAMVSNPLKTEVLRPELLSAINSVEIESPVMKQGVSAKVISPQDARGIISNAAAENLTLRLVSNPNSALGGKGVVVPGASAADAVLKTEILRFDERQGSAFGGEPSVVSFRMTMYSPRAKADLWNAQYFMKQEALSENLLKIRERVGPSGLGAGWSTAHEVFKQGVNQALLDFNSSREQRFIAKGR